MLIDNSLNADVSNNLVGEDRNQIIIMQSIVIKIHPVMSKKALKHWLPWGYFSEQRLHTGLALFFQEQSLQNSRRYLTLLKTLFSVLWPQAQLTQHQVKRG